MKSNEVDDEGDKKCKYGTGKQETSTCGMIYIHWPGYYPTKESYEYALNNLCPNSRQLCKRSS
jgi:hypothetical protein